MRSQLDSTCSSDWIELAFQAKFNCAELARLCNVSLRHLERYFDEAFHVSPKYWLQDLRMRASAQMILQKKSQKEIASGLAFSDVPHFVREFKRQYGCTPKAYLRIESARSADRSDVSNEWGTLEKENRRALLHPRDARSLLTTHLERLGALRSEKAPFAVPQSEVPVPIVQPMQSAATAARVSAT